jgi:hypothetical protein
VFGIAYGGEGDRGLFGLAFTRTAGLAAAYSAVERSHKWTDNKVARLGSPAADQMGADELTDSPRAEPPSCLTINIGRRVVASDVLNRRLPARAYEPAARRRLAVVLHGCIYCWNSVFTALQVQIFLSRSAGSDFASCRADLSAKLRASSLDCAGAPGECWIPVPLPPQRYRSMAAMSGAWLRRKVRHPWDGGATSLDHVLRHAGLSDHKAELEQLAMDARRSPQRIVRAHPPDQRA